MAGKQAQRERERRRGRGNAFNMGANGGKNAEESKEADGAGAVAVAVVAAELMLQLVKRFNADYKCHTHTRIHIQMGTHMCAHTQWQKIIRKLHWTTTSPTMTTTTTASFRLLRSCPRHDKRLQSVAGGVRG